MFGADALEVVGGSPDGAAGGLRATKARRKPRKGTQLGLGLETKSTGRGGARPGAGRKRANPRTAPKTSHRRRPDHAARCPVHVTMRVARHLPSLRCEAVQNMLKRVVKEQAHRAYGAAFQVVHFSIQDDHLHLVVEARGASTAELEASPGLVGKRAARGLETKDRDMLRRGIAGLAIAFARRLNGLLDRRGYVWADRHHRRDLASPTDVRHVLVYVLQNFIRHGARVYGIGATDRFSTAPSFDGWREPHATHLTYEDTEPWRPRPRTWLLGHGWLRAGGRISTLEAPRVSVHTKIAPEVLAYVPERDPRDFFISSSLVDVADLPQLALREEHVPPKPRAVRGGQRPPTNDPGTRVRPSVSEYARVSSSWGPCDPSRLDSLRLGYRQEPTPSTRLPAAVSTRPAQELRAPGTR